MKRLITALTFALLSVQIWAKETVTISTSQWSPYITSVSPQYGSMSTIINEAFANVGIKVEYVFLPWARAYEGAKSGEVDATSYWYKDEKHERDFLYSDPLTTDEVVFFRLKKKAGKTWRQLDDFNGFRIGLTRGFTYTKAMWDYAEKHKGDVYIVGSDKQNFQMLMLGREDIVPAQKIVGQHILETLISSKHPDIVEMLSPPLSVRTGHLLFPKASKHSEDLIRQFNKGLAELKRSGRLKTLQQDLVVEE